MASNASAGNELAGPIGHADLIQYQPGAIVSRTLIKKPSGTVTAFAFDQDEGLSEHTTPYDALIVTLDGQAEIKIAGVAHTTKLGEMIMLPANKPHAVKALTKFKMLLIMIKA